MAFSLRLLPVEYSGIFSFADLTVKGIGDDLGPTTGSVADYICDYGMGKSLGPLSTSLWLVGTYPLGEVTRFVFRPGYDPEEGRRLILFTRLVELMKEWTSTTCRTIPELYTAEEMVFEGRLILRGL